MQRRDAIRSLFAGSALMPAVVSDLLAEGTSPGGPHFPPRAKNIIFIYLSGGFSHLDSFDPKPALVQAAAEGKKIGSKKLLAPQWEFMPRGGSGIEISELFPHIARRADDLCLIRSMHTDAFNHHPAQLMMTTGVPRFGRPSLGSWLTYGLGSESESLPGYVVLAAGRGSSGGVSNWTSGFLPSTYQGVVFRSDGEPVLNLNSPPAS